MEWIYLRRVCYDFGKDNFQVVEPSENDFEVFKQLPVKVEAVTMDDIRARRYKSMEITSGWFFILSDKVDVAIQQLVLLHTVAVHPDLFPPVGIAFILHR